MLGLEAGQEDDEHDENGDGDVIGHESVLPSGDRQEASHSGHDSAHNRHHAVVETDVLTVLVFIGEEVSQDGHGGGVGDAPAHAGCAQAHNHKVVDVGYKGSQARAHREDGKADNHDPFLIDPVAEHAGNQTKRESGKGGAGDAQIDKPFGRVRKYDVELCGNRVDDKVTQSAHGREEQGEKSEEQSTLAELRRFGHESLLVVPHKRVGDADARCRAFRRCCSQPTNPAVAWPLKKIMGGTLFSQNQPVNSARRPGKAVLKAPISNIWFSDFRW